MDGLVLRSAHYAAGFFIWMVLFSGLHTMQRFLYMDGLVLRSAHYAAGFFIWMALFSGLHTMQRFLYMDGLVLRSAHNGQHSVTLQATESCMGEQLQPGTDLDLGFN